MRFCSQVASLIWTQLVSHTCSWLCLRWCCLLRICPTCWSEMSIYLNFGSHRIFHIQIWHSKPFWSFCLWTLFMSVDVFIYVCLFICLCLCILFILVCLFPSLAGLRGLFRPWIFCVETFGEPSSLLKFVKTSVNENENEKNEMNQALNWWKILGGILRT